jgi:hypothetical protein
MIDEEGLKTELSGDLSKIPALALLNYGFTITCICGEKFDDPDKFILHMKDARRYYDRISRKKIEE